MTTPARLFSTVFVFGCLLSLSAMFGWAADEQKAGKADRSAKDQSAKTDKIDPKAIEFFESKVRPLLIDNCLDCHSEDEPEGGLRLDSLAGILKGGELGPAIVLGKPEQSLLIRAINHGELLKMPEKEKLRADQIAALATWVKMGAPWPGESGLGKSAAVVPVVRAPKITDAERNYWAFQPPVRRPAPKVKNSTWARSPIDHFILARLEAAGLAPAPAADKRTLLRRASYDLTGLPPTPEEIADFLADGSPQAFTRLVDRLLASPRYGERWGRHWLDVARYADSNGLDENLAYIQAYRYRDYVIEAINDDKPYDRFVQEQLAGDLLAASGDDRAERHRLVATAFLSLGAKMLAEDDPAKMEMDIVDEQVSTTAAAFMGLTFGCARCHDHKFDPLSMADYYALAGIFKSTKTMENFKVVAKWYERPMETAEYHRRKAEHEQQLAAAKKELGEATQAANAKLTAGYRRDLGKYLLAANELLRNPPPEAIADGRQALGPLASLPSVAGRGVLLEAEAFQRGNVGRETKTYGVGIGVLMNIGPMPNFAEYDIELPADGTYQVELRYAAAAARPLQLIINGKTVKEDACGKATGGWFPEQQKWFVEGVYRFKQGRNVLRLERAAGPVPHIDKVLVISTGMENSPQTDKPAGRSASAIASESKLDVDRLLVWRNYLRDLETAKEKSELFGPWLLYAKLSSEKFADSAKAITEKLKETATETTPVSQPIRRALVSNPPSLLADVAARYQAVVDDPEGRWQDEIAKTPLGSAPLRAESKWDKPTVAMVKKLKAGITKLEKNKPTAEMAMGATDGKPADIRIHLRGNHLTLGAIAPRVFPRVIAGEDQEPIGAKQSGRLELARWLTSPDHPLASRVMANRIWQWHFGSGLVPTPDNFGSLGERPTHPQLLDWLALEFSEGGWSIKSLHRTIMLSASYQMSTAYNERAAEADLGNRLYWRFNRRRLSAEEVRDTVLMLGDTLDLSMGGSLLTSKARQYVTSTANRNDVSYDAPRRTVYMPIVRSAIYEVLQAFDFPDPAVPNGRRQSTTVTPQALFMMNSEVMASQTDNMAGRLLSSDEDDAERIGRGYEQVLGAVANEKEIARAKRFVAQVQQSFVAGGDSPERARGRAWQSLCRALIASNRFIYVE